MEPTYNDPFNQGPQPGTKKRHRRKYMDAVMEARGFRGRALDVAMAIAAFRQRSGSDLKARAPR